MKQPFRFKEFEVYDNKSSMKVGTDAVLLGAWAKPPSTGSILDIGTGSGILALMMAQKSRAHITAIDIHEDSICQAQINFKNSKWSNRLEVVHTSLESFCANQTQSFDYIISNPPFFINSLKPEKPGRIIAKHTNTTFAQQFVKSVAGLLNKQGRIAIILAANLLEAYRMHCESANIHFHRVLNVYGKSGGEKIRVLVEAGSDPNDIMIEESLCIRNPDLEYTEEYKRLTRDFYLFLH